METSQTPAPVETTPGPSWRALVLGLIITLAIGAIYMGIARNRTWWPYGTEESRADWTTYTNAEYGFSVQHPTSWHSEECKDSGPGGAQYVLAAFGDEPDLVICNSDAPFLGVVMIGVAPGVVSEQEVQSTLAALDQSSRTNTTIAGVSAIRIEGITKETEGPGPGAGKKYINIYTVQNGIIYRFVYLSEPSRVPEFEDVLKTFKFGSKVGIQEWETYTNTKYGFEIKLPKTWKGFRATTETYAIQDIATGRNLPSGVLIRIQHPQDTSATPREDMPVMVFTKTNWNLVQEGKISVGAAPVPPTKLGENSTYILALPARYNYDFLQGWEEVDAVVHTLTAFNPAS